MLAPLPHPRRIHIHPVYPKDERWCVKAERRQKKRNERRERQNERLRLEA